MREERGVKTRIVFILSCFHLIFSRGFFLFKKVFLRATRLKNLGGELGIGFLWFDWRFCYRDVVVIVHIRDLHDRGFGDERCEG